jgi:hypothetical protein
VIAPPPRTSEPEELDGPFGFAKDAALYLASATFAGLASRFQSIPLQRDWGKMAVLPYAIAALVSAALAFRPPANAARWDRWREILCVFVIAGAALWPLAMLVRLRSLDGRATHVQSEALITEEAARALFAGRDPYATNYLHGPLSSWPLGAKEHYPYLPGMILVGAPSSADLDTSFDDARVGFAAITLSVLVLALQLSRADASHRVSALQVLIALPTGAPYMAGGGDDLAVASLMILSLVFLTRAWPVAAGVSAGLAASMKQIAWLLLPFLVVAAWLRGGRRFRTRLLATGLAIPALAIVPFAIWNLPAMVEDVILFPLGLSRQTTLAASPTPGRIIASAFPAAAGLVAVVLLSIVVLLTISILVRHPPATVPAAARECALLLLLTIALAPAGRFGYLLYPINLFVWAHILGPAPSRMMIVRKTSPG